MIIKRVSYFTFIVAITTLASVSACSQAKAMTGHVIDSNDPAFDYAETTVCTTELLKILQDKGLANGTFKITKGSLSDHKEAIKIYLVINKDYKGQVSAKIFRETGKDFSYVTKLQAAIDLFSYFSTDFKADKRTAIASKNLILLE